MVMIMIMIMDYGYGYGFFPLCVSIDRTPAQLLINSKTEWNSFRIPNPTFWLNECFHGAYMK